MREDPEEQRTRKGAPHLGVLDQSNCGDSHLPARCLPALLWSRAEIQPLPRAASPDLSLCPHPLPAAGWRGPHPTSAVIHNIPGGPALLDDAAVSVTPSRPSSEHALTFQWASSEDRGVVPVRIH